MFVRPGFAKELGVAGGGALLPIIHELPTQNILGGLPGERYHLSEAALRWIVESAATPLSYAEPVSSVHAEIMHSLNGDVMVAIVETAPAVVLPDAVWVP
jgi:hypothetical protein